MRRITIAATAVALALAAAACSSASGPAWTYAPPTPPPSAAASAGASGEPSAPASGEASAPAPGEPTAVPGGSGGNEEAVVIEAHNIAFTTPEVQAPSDAAFKIDFRNGDAGIPHNVEIKDPNGGNALFNGTVFPGVAEQAYDVPALAAGTYQFVCTVHPNMTGTLKVGG